MVRVEVEMLLMAHSELLYFGSYSIEEQEELLGEFNDPQEKFNDYLENFVNKIASGGPNYIKVGEL